MTGKRDAGLDGNGVGGVGRQITVEDGYSCGGGKMTEEDGGAPVS